LLIKISISVVKAMTHYGRVSPIPPTTVTQSQTDISEFPSIVKHYDLPNVAPSHGTIKAMALRRYLLEDIMMAPVGE
jgi:hypothetical protein